MKTALIAGSTGLVGTELLKQLEGHSDYQRVHILVRKPTGHQGEKVKEHVINFDNLPDFSPGEPVDHVFCTLGTTIKKAGTKEQFQKVDKDYVVALGQQAVKWNARKFLVVTALGANPKSSIFYNRVKGETEQELSSLGLEHLFIFRPSLLMGDRKEHRAGEKTAIAMYKVINPLFIGKLKKYKGVQASRVASALVHAALNNNENFKIFESDEIQDM